MASFCSIGIISFVGLLTVGIIPMLKVSTLSAVELHLHYLFLIGQGPHQETALQLLVSLAVGTLVGDALIHLLPHALSSDHGDTDAVWKGFTATLTIIAFFVMDRVLEGLGHGHSHGPGHHIDSRDGGDEENLTSSTRTSRESTPISKVSWKYLASDRSKKSLTIKHSFIYNLSSFQTKSMSSSSLYSHSLYQRDSSYQSLTRESCCQMPSSSLMVIVGDAIHNFADGLAVGAAFSMSLAAGFSTSIAVLCHELPHEVGDFALLLHSGMSVRVAILYNCVSSIFAFIGLVVGLLLGSQGDFSSWLLAGTVGVFLYVALVSMMTELRGGDWSNTAFNTIGMLCGAVLLLFIGLYEHDLILLFEEEREHSH